METRSKRFGQGLRKHVWVWGMFILIGTLLLGSCNNGALIDEFKPIPNKRWSYNFMPTFRVHVLDTTKAYRLKVNFRLSADYRYSNLFLLIHQTTPTHQTHTKRVEFQVADQDGRWLGKGMGSLFTYQIAYYTNYHFPDTGVYQFKIEQNMRDNPLKEVSDVGFCVMPEPVQ